MLDTYSIHEGVNAERFDSERVLELVPPDGHFALMNYRSSRSFRPPFRVYPLVEDDMYSGDKVGVLVVGSSGDGMRVSLACWAAGLARHANTLPADWPNTPIVPGHSPGSSCPVPAPDLSAWLSPLPPLLPPAAHPVPAPAGRVSCHQDSHRGGDCGAAAPHRAASALRDR